MDEDVVVAFFPISGVPLDHTWDYVAKWQSHRLHTHTHTTHTHTHNNLVHRLKVGHTKGQNVQQLSTPCHSSTHSHITLAIIRMQLVHMWIRMNKSA